MIQPDRIDTRWYGQQAYRMRQMLEQLGGYDPDYSRILWNATKERKEVWYRCTGGTREWVLGEVYPGREWRDRFMASVVFVAAVLGFESELPWAVNGRMNGAVAPSDLCFPGANEIGGGLNLTVRIGGQDNDYTAIHWGDNYPVMLSKSPHYHATVSPQQLDTVAFIAGLVDNTRPTGTNAFALPDNGVFFHYDTDVDLFTHAVIRSNGVSVTDVHGTPPSPGAHVGVHMQAADDGEHIRFVFGGSVMVDWVDISVAAYANLRAAQLQPYAAVVNRAANILREFHQHDFRLIMDRGF